MVSGIAIRLSSTESAIALVGDREANLKALAQHTGAKLVLRGRDLEISGSESQVALCDRIVHLLKDFWSQGEAITPVDIATARQAVTSNRLDELRELHTDILARTRRGESIRARTFGHHRYIQAVRSHDLTFCIGPAGTGKTFLAAVLAVQALLANQYERLILTRPAVEAGERLGFLPGDLQQKVNPYLRPLYDALYEFIDPERIPAMMERGVIEVAPIAYMRGRTLNNAFIILDEAQNTTPAQMKMVLTRMGFQSRMVVTGDLTQTDLANHQTSGLAVAQKILHGISGIAFCELNRTDVVRHPLVQRIVEAYEKHEKPGK